MNFERAVFAPEVSVQEVLNGSETSVVTDTVMPLPNAGVPEKTMHGGVDASVKLNASVVFPDMFADLSVAFPEAGTLNIAPDFNAKVDPAVFPGSSEYVAGS